MTFATAFAKASRGSLGRWAVNFLAPPWRFCPHGQNELGEELQISTRCDAISYCLVFESVVMTFAAALAKVSRRVYGRWDGLR